MTAPEPARKPNPSLARNLQKAASAARALARAYDPAANETSLQKEVVRDLVWQLGRRLETFAGYAAEGLALPDLAAEAAQSCGDLATLAACNADLAASSEVAREVVEAADQAICSVESWLKRVEEKNEAALRDVRGASWKVSLARNQVL